MLRYSAEEVATIFYYKRMLEPTLNLMLLIEQLEEESGYPIDLTEVCKELNLIIHEGKDLFS